MSFRRFVFTLAVLCLAFAPRLAAADAAKPGYKVVVEVSYDEQGLPEGARVVQSDDPTSDTILHRIAMTLSAQVKQAPHLKDGKPVKFSVRIPFDFPVEDDEGPEANEAPKPRQTGGLRPVYPENLASAGIVGGAILELTIGADGVVKKVVMMRASHPEFGQSAEAAAKTWVFRPAIKDGVPIESRWRTAVAYSVDGKEVDWKWRVAPRPNLGGSVVGRPRADPAPVPPTPAPASAK
jgi:TonB family protein